MERVQIFKELAEYVNGSQPQAIKLLSQKQYMVDIFVSILKEIETYTDKMHLLEIDQSDPLIDFDIPFIDTKAQRKMQEATSDAMLGKREMYSDMAELDNPTKLIYRDFLQLNSDDFPSSVGLPKNLSAPGASPVGFAHTVLPGMDSYQHGKLSIPP